MRVTQAMAAKADQMHESCNTKGFHGGKTLLSCVEVPMRSGALAGRAINSTCSSVVQPEIIDTSEVKLRPSGTIVLRKSRHAVKHPERDLQCTDDDYYSLLTYVLWYGALGRASSHAQTHGYRVNLARNFSSDAFCCDHVEAAPKESS